MKKFFSLISDKKIMLAPGKKVIPKKEFETLKKASSILKEVKNEVISYKKSVAKEAETLKEEAYKKGFHEGLLKLNKEILHFSKQIETYTEEMKKKILPIAIKAAKKILGDELRLHKDRIVDIISQAIQPVIQHKQVKIFVNKEDLAILEKNKDKIKNQLENATLFSIQPKDDIEKGGCLIETEAGIINAELENLWRSLTTAMEKLLK